MKRQISHPKCITFIKSEMLEDWRKKEWYIKKKGKAWFDFDCDICGDFIFLGEDCITESFGTLETPYSPWENQYIKEEE